MVTRGLFLGLPRFNPSNAELNPICHLLALLGGATIVVFSRLRVKRSGPPNFSERKNVSVDRILQFEVKNLSTFIELQYSQTMLVVLYFKPLV
jgi:hypothetical protein